VHYDALGRPTQVWLPGRDSATQTPNLDYTYLLRVDGTNAVTTKRLAPDGSQLASTGLYDGLLRVRQTQTLAAGNSGRMVTDTGYDERGLPVKESVFWNNASGPATTLVTFTDTDVANQHRQTYDNLQRPTVEALWSLNSLKWQTSATYDGDRVTVTPPAGGIAQTDLLDVYGGVTTLYLPRIHPCWSSGVFIFVQGSAEAITAADA
jgi:hypothetical protein